MLCVLDSLFKSGNNQNWAEGQEDNCRLAAKIFKTSSWPTATNVSDILAFIKEVGMYMDSGFLHQQSSRKIPKLGTLGDDPIGLTCSMHVARQWAVAETIEPFETFEHACAAVKDRRIDAFLVPAAYPRLNAFIMDAELVAFDTFVMSIPALVLATSTGTTKTGVQLLFHHPAVATLLPEMDRSYEKAVEVSSNVEACRKHLELAHHSACITNALCVEYFNMSVVQILREGISMPWICFRRTDLK